MDLAELSLAIRSGAATDTGRVRTHNEDSYLAASPVFLVADGMGGHTRGDAASAETVRHFEALAGRDWVEASDLHETMVAAARAVEALASDGRAPGTTLAGVGLTLQGGRPYWLAFNIGDSRVYLFRDGRLEQISVDHSRRQELLEQGAAPESLTVGRNIITRALGGGQSALPVMDHWLLPLTGGDRILICSDGLTSEVDDDRLRQALAELDDPLEVARALVASAVEAGGQDNVTVVVVDADSDADPDDVEDTLTDVLSDFADHDDDTVKLPGDSTDELKE